MGRVGLEKAGMGFLREDSNQKASLGRFPETAAMGNRPEWKVH